jgi:LTXXQ motif family protein
LLLLLTTAALNTVEARGLGIIGRPLGVVRSVASLALGGLHGRRDRHVRLEATGGPPRTDLTGSPDWITKPLARVQVAAGAALAGWHGRPGTRGWWQHGDGGYGWVGPLFWPFAYYDIFDYALWGDGMGFWGYGYRDIYAAIFTPYDDDELTRYASPPHGRKFRRFPSLARICGDDASEFAGLPIEQIRQAIALSSDEQRVMLDDLANASLEAVQTIRSACPSGSAPTSFSRLTAMQQRLEAMKSAIARIRTPFEKFYESLDDNQKGRLGAFNDQRAPFAPKLPAAQSCIAPEALPWPAGQIQAKLRLSDTQREELDKLSRVATFARNTVNFDCQPDDDLAPPDRLATADTRLDVMLDAIKQVQPALAEFLATLSDEQKAQFETIGAKRTS